MPGEAIDLAKRLGIEGVLSINFLPNAVYTPATCIQATLQAAREPTSPPVAAGSCPPR